MKKTLKLAPVALATLMALTVAGCGNTGDKVKLISVDLTEESYGAAFKLDNKDLQTKFNTYLSSIKANGEYDKIMNKFFGDSTEAKKGFSVVGDGTATEDTMQNNTGAGKLVVGTNAPFEPFEYIENGKIYGIDMEIAAGFAASQNLEVVFMNIDFDAIFPALDAGYVDIGVAGLTVDEDRVDAYLFSDKYYDASLNLIVAGNNKDFDACKEAKDVEDILKSLKDKTIGYQLGTTAGDYVADFSNLKGESYNTSALATLDVINGNIYGVIVDNAPAAAIVKSYNAQ